MARKSYLKTGMRANGDGLPARSPGSARHPPNSARKRSLEIARGFKLHLPGSSAPNFHARKQELAPWKPILKIAAIALAVLLVIVIAIPFLIDVNRFRPQIEAQLSGALGRQVTVGNLGLSLLSGSVKADNIAIGDDPAFGKAPFITANSLKVGVELLPLILSKQLKVTEITLAQPEITLLKSASGKWNFSSIGGASAANQPKSAGTSPANFSVSKLKVSTMAS